MISLKNLTKIYPSAVGEVRALDDLTLEIPAEDFVAIRGPSGCGKSTLLSLIGGLALPTSGLVQIDGKTISEMSSADRAKFRGQHIGFVFQMFHLLPYVNVLGNVLLAAPSKDRLAKNRAEELLHQFGLTDRLTHNPGQLSAGERQRVAMARAFLNSPRLILADEPTGNLDPKNASIILDHLQQYNESGGTIVLVTHDQTSADRAKHSIDINELQMASTAGNGRN